MINYDKNEVKKQLTIDNIFDLLVEWGGDPEYTDFGILSSTICHNNPGEGSKKLYFYENSGLFRCYTGCQEVFDIFELGIKITQIQKNIDWDLNDAVRYVANRFSILGQIENEEIYTIEDWKYIENYKRIQEIEKKDYKVILQEYDNFILNNLNYNVKISPWLKEDISQEVIDFAKIGFYPGGDQITIPHYDVNNRFIGLRGRALCTQEAERYGKYRPLKINNILYSHPLGMNLYGINWARDNFPVIKKAIIFESEKAVLKYMSYFGIENSIAVACCGSNISIFQIMQLINLGVEEIIIAFDRQFIELGDLEFLHLTSNIKKMAAKYKKYANISCIFDKKKITGYKDAPIDCGKEKFLTLYKERIML